MDPVKLTLPFAEQAKKYIFLSLCVLYPYIFYSGFEDFYLYLFYAFAAFVFWDCENYNLRFLIAMIAVQEAFTIIVDTTIIFTVRVILSLDDYTAEILMHHVLRSLTYLFMLLVIFYRRELVALFRKTTSKGQSYHLIGVEISLGLSYLFLFILNTTYLIAEWNTLIDITGIESYEASLQTNAREIYTFTHAVAAGFIVFSLQSYNFKWCRREWRLR